MAGRPKGLHYLAGAGGSAPLLAMAIRTSTERPSRHTRIAACDPICASASEPYQVRRIGDRLSVHGR